MDLLTILRATATDTFVVLQNGVIVFDYYDGGTGATAPPILISGTKAAIGLLAGSLQHSGDIDPEALVSRYVPEINDTAYRGATVRQLLDMRGGVALDERDAQTYNADARRGTEESGGSVLGLHGVLTTLKTLKRPHGGPLSYISANTDLVGWALERPAGQPVLTLLSERLWKPMRTAANADIIVDADASPWCSGGMSAAAEDLARLGQLLVDDGMAGSRRVLPKAWIDDL